MRVFKRLQVDFEIERRMNNKNKSKGKNNIHSKASHISMEMAWWNERMDIEAKKRMQVKAEKKHTQTE